MMSARPPEVRRLAAIVPAAGRGNRMGSALAKQYLLLAGQTMLEHSVNALLRCPIIERVVVALAADDQHFQQLALACEPRISSVVGGSERADSVLAALDALAAEGFQWVLVHDAARPCVPLADIERLIDHCLNSGQGGLLAAPVRDTMKRGDASGLVLDTVPREQLWHALTPQMFPTGTLKRALEEGLALGALITDEASAMERAGFTVKMVEGRADNIKVTRPEDLSLAELFLQQQSARQQARPD